MPLLEVVTEPDLRSGAEAAAYGAELRKVVTFLGISNGNMQVRDGARTFRMHFLTHLPCNVFETSKQVDSMSWGASSTSQVMSRTVRALTLPSFESRIELEGKEESFLLLKGCTSI